MRTRNQKLLLLALLVLGVASAAPESAPRFRADELHPAPSGSAAQGVQPGSIQGSAQGSWDAVTLGRVEPRSGEIKIAAPLPGGRIADVLVKPNEDVFAGELLVRLDDEEALARVAEADAQVALHKRARNDQSAPAASADRRKAEDAAADSERSLADARSALDKTTADWRAGSASQADLDAARSALSRAQDRVRERQDVLAKLKASADTPLPTRLEGELNVAQAEWRVAQAALEKTQIRAPADGVVLRVDARNGRIGGAVIGAGAAGHRRCVGLARARRGERAGSWKNPGRAECSWFAPRRFTAVSSTARFRPSPASSGRAGSIRAIRASSTMSMCWRSLSICRIPGRSSSASRSTSISNRTKQKPNSKSCATFGRI